MERYLGVAKNTDIAVIREEVLDELVREVVDETGAEAVTTNWVASQRVEYWEGRWGVPVFDTVSAVLWDMLRMGGFDAKTVKGWGSLFHDVVESYGVDDWWLKRSFMVVSCFVF